MSVLLLRYFLDVLDSFKGKKFTYRTNSGEPVPEDSLKLWEKRGFLPSKVGCAFVKFEGMDKEYCYPAYFWSE